MSVRIAGFVVASLLAATAFAHDFWIEPAKYRVGKGEVVKVPLRVGMEYVGDPVPRDDLRTEKFVVLGPDGVEPVTGEDQRDPAGRFTPAKDGVYVVAFRNTRRSIEIEAAKFETYLKDEGLERISKIRAERKDTDKPGMEVYSRCAKALFYVGDGAKDGHDRVVGMRLEIVPETNPYVVAAGAALSFRVLFEDKPLADALVVARNHADPKRVVTARTDAEGRVKLTLAREGEWMVKCVHMVAADKAETGMDWESLWASVSFELAAAK
jgi:uncharacterized GH25 family protein